MAYVSFRLTVVLALIMIAMAFPSPSFGATEMDCHQDYPDPDDNQLAGSLVLNCSPGFFNDHDQIIVYPIDRRFDINHNWQTNIRFENEIWIFDAAASDRASLIIRFTREEESLVAEFYDDQDGDGSVAYHLDSGKPTITESQYWTVRVVAPEGWWVNNKKINYNLDLQIDGAIVVTFASEVFQEFLHNDGIIDFEIRVRDRDRDGQPDDELRNAYPQVTERWSQYRNIYRSILIASGNGIGDPPAEGGIFWPLLGIALPESQSTDLTEQSNTIKSYAYGVIKRYNESRPPIQVDWSTGRIRYVGEFVASHGTEKNWYIESKSLIIDGQTNRPNFENPFAFYDLASDNDGFPELQIRVEYNLPNDFFLQRNFDQPINVVRYSWDQDNNQTWDFKLDAIGRHSIDSVVSFPELAVQTIPYADLPNWVNEQSWDSVGFVAVEGTLYRGTEGIYESLGASLKVRDEYITGHTDMPPVPDASQWPIGLRGEYNNDLRNKMELYLSPIDLKLHLKGANYGLWKLDERYSIRYASISGEMIDHWVLLDSDKVRSRLIVIGNHAILVNGNVVRLAQIRTPKPLFSGSPPRTNQEWQTLGQVLADQSPSFAPDDFAAMLDRLQVDSMIIRGAGIHDLRIHDQGFRFAIDLYPNYTFSGKPFLDLVDRPSAPYVVNYDGDFHIVPVGRPDINLSLQILANQEMIAGSSMPIQVEAINHGSGDISNLTLLVEAQGPHNVQTLGQQKFDVLSAEPTRTLLNWQPDAPGTWHITLWLKDQSGRVVAETKQYAEIISDQEKTNFTHRLLLFVILISMAISAGIAISTVWPTTRRES